MTTAKLSKIAKLIIANMPGGGVYTSKQAIAESRRELVRQLSAVEGDRRKIAAVVGMRASDVCKILDGE